MASRILYIPAKYNFTLLLLPSPPDCCSLGDIRLVGGQHSGEGRLEYCSGGVWGTVCNEEWNLNNTLVACRQLGFNVTTQGKV